MIRNLVCGYYSAEVYTSCDTLCGECTLVQTKAIWELLPYFVGVFNVIAFVCSVVCLAVLNLDSVLYGDQLLIDGVMTGYWHMLDDVFCSVFFRN